MYIYRETNIIYAILRCSEFCDCNQYQYDQWNALWLWNHNNHWCGNMAPSLPQCLCRGLSSSWNLPQSLCSGYSSSRSLPQTCAEVSATPQFQYSNIQSPRILNAPPSLQVLSGARENALAESESTLHNSRGGWEHLEVPRSSGEGYRSVWDIRQMDFGHWEPRGVSERMLSVNLDGSISWEYQTPGGQSDRPLE